MSKPVGRCSRHLSYDISETKSKHHSFFNKCGRKNVRFLKRLVSKVRRRDLKKLQQIEMLDIHI